MSPTPKRPPIPLGIRWLFWLNYFPRVFHRPVGCLVLVVAPLFAFAFLFAIVWSATKLLPAACWSLLRWGAEDPSRKVAVEGVLLATGLAFYRLRRWSRSLYGWIEVTAAGVLMWQGLDAAETSREKALPLAIGGIYFLVRGFDNVVVGSKEAKDRYQARVAAAAPEIIQRANDLAATQSPTGEASRE